MSMYTKRGDDVIAGIVPSFLEKLERVKERHRQEQQKGEQKNDQKNDDGNSTNLDFE